jgi:hypothetical protein
LVLKMATMPWVVLVDEVGDHAELVGVDVF